MQKGGAVRFRGSGKGRARSLVPVAFLAFVWRWHLPAIPPGIFGGMMLLLSAWRRVRPPSRSSRRGSSAVRLGLGSPCLDAQCKRQGKADARQRKQEDVQQSKARMRGKNAKESSLTRYVYEAWGYGVRGQRPRPGTGYPTIGPTLPAIKFFKRSTFV